MSSVLYFLHGLKRWGPDCTVLQSQKHPTGMFLMGSPCAPLAPARRAFQLQTAVRRLSPKDPPPLVQGAALGMGRKASNFLFFFQKESWTKKNAPFGKSFRLLRKAAGGRCPLGSPATL
jgi:hypothetical protein